MRQGTRYFTINPKYQIAEQVRHCEIKSCLVRMVITQHPEVVLLLRMIKIRW